MANSITKRSKDPQPESIVAFNGDNNSSYQAFENDDDTVSLYLNEMLVAEFPDMALFIQWSQP